MTQHPAETAPLPLPVRKDPNRRAALACASLMGMALVLVAFGRQPVSVASIDPADVANSVELRFADMPDGTVVALDAATGAELARVVPGKGGFIRVTMRSFANERKQRGFGSAEPFALVRLIDGDLVLFDPLTGRRMLLDAFGPANEGVFAGLLDEADRLAGAETRDEAALVNEERTTR